MQADKHGAPLWSEETSQTFLDYGRYFVPAREHQIETVCDLIPASNHPFTVFELCCGEGLLEASSTISTKRFTDSTVQPMLNRRK